MRGTYVIGNVHFWGLIDLFIPLPSSERASDVAYLDICWTVYY